MSTSGTEEAPPRLSLPGLVEVDGSFGEGGGQILRSSLSLSCITRRPLRLFNIRAGRSNPGLQRQHLACVLAAAKLVSARTTGAEMGSKELVFVPPVPEGISFEDVAPSAAKLPRLGGGAFVFEIDGAGSCMLLLQTVLHVLLFASDGESHVTVKGGTHADFAPSADFIKSTFVPLLRTMGHDVTCEIKRYGFFPAGGGEVVVTINPTASLNQPLPSNKNVYAPFELPTHGTLVNHSVKLIHTRVGGHKNTSQAAIDGMVATIAKQMTKSAGDVTHGEMPAFGHGVACVQRLEFAQAPTTTSASSSVFVRPTTWTMVFSATGNGNSMGSSMAKQLEHYTHALEPGDRHHHESGGRNHNNNKHSSHHAKATAKTSSPATTKTSYGAADEYLADQLLLPLVLGFGGQYAATTLSLHTETNVAVIHRFLGPSLISLAPLDAELCAQVAVNKGPLHVRVNGLALLPYIEHEEKRTDAAAAKKDANDDDAA